MSAISVIVPSIPLFLRKLQRYERELEIEKEVEQEVERQLPRMTPRAEKDWDVSELIWAREVQSLPVKTLDLRGVLASAKSLRCYAGAWPQSLKVVCTKNYHRAIMEAVNLDDYLRPVDAAILFKSGELLLLSEREADKALAVYWQLTDMSPKPETFFVNVPLWREGFGVMASEPAGLLPSGPAPQFRDASQLVGLQVFMGDASFKTEMQRERLNDMAKSMGSNAAALMKQLVPCL